MTDTASNLFVIFGNQLFDPKILKEYDCKIVYMAEDYGLCTYEKHHKLKIYLFLCAMREYRDELQLNGIKVHYLRLDQRKKDLPYSDSLKEFVMSNQIKTINFFEIEDKPLEVEIVARLEKEKIAYKVHRSPMFMFSRQEFHEAVKDKKKFRMSSFYQLGRKKFNILLDENKKPIGGKWSFDEDNRKKIPPNTTIPEIPKTSQSIHHDAVISAIEKNFPSHPGSLKNIWFPVTRKSAQVQLELFLKQRLDNFGLYEDAMLEGKNFLFHSCLSASMNIGLLSPAKVIDKTLSFAKQNSTPLNSVEGFIRQILGWREFIRGIYQEKGEYQQNQNYWNHKNGLTSSWYDGTTGISPLDDCIRTALDDGYSHHIPRLMVISNLMNLCEIDPKNIYTWFMEMYVDSSDWVMTPNVFGMATYADGGLMSTKPYTCGSNYILKMSNYKKGDWCDVVDGLYWRFMEKNRKFYESNPRLSVLVRSLDRMDIDRKTLIFEKAEQFIKENTEKN
jgi:deoxyribodipyrimidine photolyase-related protein